MAVEAPLHVAHDWDAEQDGRPDTLQVCDEVTLRKALDGPLLTRPLPGHLEAAFRQHTRERAARLLRLSVYGMIAVYAVVSGAAALFTDEPGLNTWLLVAVLPVGIVLALIWLATRLNDMESIVEPLLVGGVFVSILGCGAAALYLRDDLFAQIAAYETIYVLIIAFSILRLPLIRVALASLLAFVLAAVAMVAMDHPVLWLDSMLYFMVPWTLCVVVGAMLEYAERKEFLQNELLTLESLRLRDMNQQAEQALARRTLQADYLSLIAGNPAAEVLFQRTLGFLVERTGAQVGVAYRLGDDGLLHPMASWGAALTRGAREEALDPAGTLLEPVMAQRAARQVRDLPPGYLPIVTGSQTLKPGAILVVPVCQGDDVVAVIELGRLAPFSAEQEEVAGLVVTHFAYAVQAALLRRQQRRVS